MPSGRPLGARQPFDLDEPRSLEPLEHQLGDAITARHLDSGGGVEVDQQHLDLAAITGVDGSRRVHDGHPALSRKTRTGVNQRDITSRQRNADARGYQRPLSGRKGEVDGAQQVCAGIPGMGVRRQRHVVVDAADQHLDHL